uniref:AAA+ ATPase domain-containing protein n=1 Tax=viral metagenome TaxID=1070528 RepID=A0A6C0JYS3_9ZZZZ
MISNEILPHHEAINQKLNFFYETKKIPNIIIYGSNGTGKKTIIYSFLNKIYQSDKQKIKSNVMIVNCAHGKGIKFIREDLKLFAKTNIHFNNGILFKSIVLLNADFLTIDAQSALRRCIELFSHTTRFFIIIENKNKLLNPILSRFCTIYVPEHMMDEKIVNLHTHSLDQKYPINDVLSKKYSYISNKLDICFKQPDYLTTNNINDLVCHFYEHGFSCLEIIDWINDSPLINVENKSELAMKYHKIRREFRCEKMLMFFLLLLVKRFCVKTA